MLPKVQAFCSIKLEDYYILHTVNMFSANIYTLIFKPNVKKRNMLVIKICSVPITSILSHQQRNMLVIKNKKKIKEKKGQCNWVFASILQCGTARPQYWLLLFCFPFPWVCLPKTEQNFLIILSVSVLCFVWTTGPHDTFPHASPSHTLFCCVLYADDWLGI